MAVFPGYLESLQRSVYLPAEQMRELQAAELRRLLRFVSTHVPYYSRPVYLCGLYTLAEYYRQVGRGALRLKAALTSAETLLEHKRRAIEEVLVNYAIPLVRYPTFDTALVSILNKLAGRPISVGGRDHSSHRLASIGLDERQVVLDTVADDDVRLEFGPADSLDAEGVVRPRRGWWGCSDCIWRGCRGIRCRGGRGLGWSGG